MEKTHSLDSKYELRVKSYCQFLMLVLSAFILLFINALHMFVKLKDYYQRQLTCIKILSLKLYRLFYSFSALTHIFLILRIQLSKVLLILSFCILNT